MLLLSLIGTLTVLRMESDNLIAEIKAQKEDIADKIANKNENLGCIFIDDPIQALDDINILSMIDLLRNIAYSLDKQIILTTHDRNFFELLKKKVPAELFGSRFLKLKQRGVFSEG